MDFQSIALPTELHHLRKRTANIHFRLNCKNSFSKIIISISGRFTIRCDALNTNNCLSVVYKYLRVFMRIDPCTINLQTSAQANEKFSHRLSL